MESIDSKGIVNLSRRQFMQGGAALTLGILLGRALPAQAAAAAAPAAEPAAYVRIGADNSVTIIAQHLEMGQGTYTGLATLLADEMDAAWSQVRMEGAPADAARYGNRKMGGMQGTGGSTAMANSWETMRRAGAAARAMLVAAAAKQWDVPRGTITVREGVVLHDPSGRRANFGELAAAAARESVPERLFLKNPHEFTLIGKPLARIDNRDKVTGAARYTQDVKLPGMLVALVQHAPRFGAKVASFDDKAARRVKGVVEVVQIPSGVAVLAGDFWSARRGRDALRVKWDESAAFALSSRDIYARYRELAKQPGTVARQDGDADAALAGAAKKLQVGYEFPFLAHAAMEPLNCVIRLDSGGCEAWNGEQLQSVDQAALAELFGLPPERVKINMLYAGGSFGRRANPASDYVLECGHIVKALAGGALGGRPVKLVWTREDDMRAGYYRPAYVHALEAGLDAQGKIVAWKHRIVGQGILASSPFKARVQDGIDPTVVKGAYNLPYGFGTQRVDVHMPELPVPVLWWRSVASSHNAYAVETFLDQIAAAAGRDPADLRLELLAGRERHLAVLRLVLEKADWTKPLAQGAPGDKRGRGLALHESFDSVVAQVAEVSIKADGSFTVDRVVCAVDCGLAINPDVVRAQMEGGIGYGLSAALSGAITFNKGRVDQSNFDNYTVLRMPQMPKVDVHIVPSAAAPTGVGEPGLPPIAPAVANALAQAGAKRITSLPIKLA
ncbi:MAG: xanthine dehydrogenase family protein molybdopterin-binding subunit [Rhodocyclaceae bacterium]|nr:xanthine dehydrogenase family protein molybdopterin-binding subunit [Rhodocyclaceae bacterium]